MVVDGGLAVREPLPYWTPMRVLGGVLLVAGLIALVRAFVRFVVEGLGTPAPVADRSVWSSAGYIASFATPCTWRYWRPSSASRCSWADWTTTVRRVTWTAVAAFVRYYKEPSLTRRFGEDYEAYRRHVPAWLPRLRPWEPAEPNGPGAR